MSGKLEMIRALKTGLLYCSVIVTQQLAGALPATAQKSYCHIMNDQAFKAAEPGLHFGCVKKLAVIDNNLFGVNPAQFLVNPLIGTHDGLIFDADWLANEREKILRFSGGVDYNRLQTYSSWANIYIGSSRTDGQKTALDLTAFNRRKIVDNDVQVDLLFNAYT